MPNSYQLAKARRIAASMKKQDQRKIDEAIAGYVVEGIRIGEPPVAGDKVTGIDVRFGDEGPGGSWSRLAEQTIEQRHIDLAAKWLA